MLVELAAVIHDPVTTTDELIPSGETSSYRSNPLKLSEFALSRRVPEYVGISKRIQAQDLERRAGNVPENGAAALAKVGASAADTSFGSCVFANKPGDGSAREQAASCQKVLGGWANLAKEYATKRYRSNLINWGMLPFLVDEDDKALPFALGDYVFVPGVRKAVLEKNDNIDAYAIKADGTVTKFVVHLGDLTDAERDIITAGCLINYYRG